MPGKKVSLKEALRWAYSVQMVHLRDHAADGSSGRWLRGGETSCLANLDMVGQGTIAARALEFHPDAEAIHEAVLALGPIYSRLVIEFGRTGVHPEPCDPIAKPQRFEWRVGGKFEREEEGVWRGEHITYRVTADETVTWKRPLYGSGSRRYVRVVGEEQVTEPVWYCPISWWPDPIWCEAVNGISAHWTRALAMLWERLAPGILRERAIAAPD